MSTADFESLPESAVVGEVEVKDSVDKGAENKEKKDVAQGTLSPAGGNEASEESTDTNIGSESETSEEDSGDTN